MERKKLEIEEIKHIEIDILKHVVKICNRHQLRYFLAYGTLLGAVRHQGFIPWDDDIDICMPRPDYDKFIEIWQKEKTLNESLNFSLLFPSPENDYFYEFAKVIATDTVCEVNLPILDIKGMGIWIDIFPLDGVPAKKSLHIRKVRFWRQMRSLSVYTEVPIKKITDVFIYVVWKCCQLVGWRFFQNKVLKLAKKYPYEHSERTACVALAEDYHQFYPRQIFNQTVSVPFEGEYFNSPKDFDFYLKRTYGDYMKLPPIEQQVSLHQFDAYKTLKQ